MDKFHNVVFKLVSALVTHYWKE